MGIPDFDLKGRIGLVTGGSKGIGFGIAKGLSKFGANVVIVSRHFSECQKAADLLEQKFGVSALPLEADVTQIPQIDRMVKESLKRFDKIDILVSNAGTEKRQPALEVTEDIWDKIHNTNLKGSFFCAQIVARESMVPRKKGKIIFISSVQAIVAQEYQAAYGPTKAGLMQLTKVLAWEWARYNINVNAIAPGSIETDQNREWLKIPENYQANMNKICLRRIGTPEDIIGAAVLLASDLSDYITGETIFVDGGWTIL